MRPENGRGRTRRAVVTLTIALIGTQLAAVPPAAAGGINNSPSYIHVYTNNVENLEQVDDPCPGDWLDLIYYMKRFKMSPDIYLVQQISGQDQIDKLAARMTQELSGTYVGIASVANPTPKGTHCGGFKSKQTTGIIYRPGRFQVVNQGRWRTNYDVNGSCVNDTEYDRAAALGIRFLDKIANRYVSVSTVHFPTLTRGGGPCIDHNITESGAETAGLGAASLRIWGGDLNNDDLTDSRTFVGWYNKVNGDRGGALGWRDVIYNTCYKINAANVNNCAYNNWTIQGEKLRRIDFLFAKLGDGTRPRVEDGRTPTFNEGDAADNFFTNSDREDRDYSDHRAVQASIFYSAG